MVRSTALAHVIFDSRCRPGIHRSGWSDEEAGRLAGHGQTPEPSSHGNCIAARPTERRRRHAPQRRSAASRRGIGHAGCGDRTARAQRTQRGRGHFLRRGARLCASAWAAVRDRPGLFVWAVRLPHLLLLHPQRRENTTGGGCRVVLHGGRRVMRGGLAPAARVAVPAVGALPVAGRQRRSED
jgi:hypothetical protein